MTSDAPTSLPAAAADEATPVTVAQRELDRRAVIEAAEPRILLVLAAFHVLLRIGWIFKTETVIMPDFLDAIAGAGWIRGLLPVLSRVGQSVPPLCFAETLQRSPSKSRAL